MIKGLPPMRKVFLLLFALLALAGCETNWITIVASLNPDNAAPQTASQGDAVRGADIYAHGINEAPPCMTCHALAAGGYSLGPVMGGISERAGTRVEGLTAEAYLHQSIVDPAAHLVGGFRNIMYPQYGEKLTEQDITDLIAYLMTL